MVRIGLHHLETVCCIAHLGSYAAAADRLNTTQSGISSRVREVEARLKTRIFRKEGRRMLLTVQGRDLVERCGPLLRQMNDVLLSVADESDPSGTVSLGLGESAAMICLPSFLGETSAAMPKLGWDITVDVTANLRQKLLDTALDIAVMAAPVDASELVVAPIGRIDLSWIAAASFFAAHGDAASLADGPVWSLPRPSTHYGVVAGLMRAHGLPTSSINTCNHVQVLIEIVSAGRGIALLAEQQQVLDGLSSGALRRLRMPQPAHTVEFVAARRQDETDPVILAVFEHVLKMRI
ncbi:LysR family transcriptional regulator [Bordetella genomosp. 13]|uniref:LysR family transcriptional regulator n=1 Tax=Bordetella genomosp. 13 TaxID=463040 RepID=UPI001642489E|nr:LysR family transcriptional regulator [Bordetella genomosp. 13]